VLINRLIARRDRNESLTAFDTAAIGELVVVVPGDSEL
jgi:hypothetical protein